MNNLVLFGLFSVISFVVKKAKMAAQSVTTRHVQHKYNLQDSIAIITPDE